jgi:hypothetical protein
MTERMLITKLVRTGERADLYAHGHRYKDLTLFDLSDLADVGIDYNALETGVETPCRFWAIYEESDKLNKANNPYKDIVALEPIDKPATSTSTDTSAIVGELRAIKALLQQILGQIGATPSGDPHQLPTPPGPKTADSGNPQSPVPHTDRDGFYTLAATAITNGLHQDDIDAILSATNGQGWDLATRCLAAAMERLDLTAEEHEYRQHVVDRMLEVLASTPVETGLVEHQLEPGWQWLTPTETLVIEGKRLIAAIQGDDA